MKTSPLAGALLIVAVGTPAAARTAATVPYPIADVFPTAVRFLRIDRGYTVREKDEPSGYVLFEYADGARTHKGSLELVRVTDGDGRDATRVVFTLPDLPRHHEQVLVDKLAAKLRDERGTPPPPKRPVEDRPAAPDAGTLPRPPQTKELPRGSGQL